MPPPPVSAGGARPAPGEGLRLDALLARSARAGRPLPEALACHVVAEVAGLLAAPAHVPRAVTPFHIHLGAHGQVRLAGPDASDADGLAYAAPERVRPRTPPDARAEVFSLGLVLLQLLTGQHLFPGAERFEAEVRRARGPPLDGAREACARELERCLGAYGPARLEAATRAVSVALRPLVHRALAVSPEERYPDSAALGHALREHLREAGQEAGPALLRAELRALGVV